MLQYPNIIVTFNERDFEAVHTDLESKCFVQGIFYGG